MDWIKVRIFRKKEELEMAQGFLLDLGIEGWEMENDGDIEDYLQDSSVYWDYIDEALTRRDKGPTAISLYLPEDKKGYAQLEAIKKEFPHIEIESIKSSDWENNWKEYFKPIEIGKTLVIKPSWETYHNADNRKVVTLDPGNSFGTGTHESTYLCLVEAERLVKKGMKVLDAGCGSGILGISALALGASFGVFFDIDSSAVNTCEENLKLNLFEDKYLVEAGDLLKDRYLRELVKDEGDYDLVFANIVPDVIISILEELFKVLKKGGILITSGIIIERKDEVADKMKDLGFVNISFKEMNGWVVLVGEK